MTTRAGTDHATATNRRAERGITLIEMIIVVAILGIVASLVYPSYLDRTRKSRRVDATSTLMNIAGEQERFFLRNNRYANSAAELGITESDNGLYSIAIVPAGDGTEYVATATPIAGKSQEYDVDCTAISIDQLGRRLASGATAGDDTASLCWR